MNKLIEFVTNDKWYIILICFALFASAYSILTIDDKVNEVHKQYEEYYNNHVCYPRHDDRKQQVDMLTEIRELQNENSNTYKNTKR